MKANKVVDNLLAEIPAVMDGSIVSRTLYHDEKMRAVLFAFAAGESLSEHTSSSPAILHFLEGNASVTLGEELMDASAGSWVHMPANLPHSITAETPVQMLLLLLSE